MKMLFTALCVGIAGTGVALAQDLDATALQALNGTYESTQAEPWYGGYGHREFVFANGQWSLTFTHALDPGMTMRTFRFRTGGGYAVGAEDSTVAGAYRTVFDEDWKHLTMFMTDPAMIAAFGMADCGLTANLEADISGAGCAAWRPVAVCGEDHDLLAGQGDELYFGVRPDDNDMCTADKTPTALLAVPVRLRS